MHKLRTPICYFRAAQAYMFISIPTGTSTIFGAFQDIFLSLRTNIVRSKAITQSDKMPALDCFGMRVPQRRVGSPQGSSQCSHSWKATSAVKGEFACAIAELAHGFEVEARFGAECNNSNRTSASANKGSHNHSEESG